MIVTTKEVKKIAELAHLEFSSEELKPFIEHFEEILEYFRQLEAVSTDGVEPMNYALQQSEPVTPMREDVIGRSFSPERAVREAPDAVDQQFRVPRVIEE